MFAIHNVTVSHCWHPRNRLLTTVLLDTGVWVLSCGGSEKK